MQRIIKRALLGVLIGGGIALGGAGLAYADETSGDEGLLSGTQAVLGVDLPVTIGGNAVSVIGDSTSSGATTQAPAAQEPAPAQTSGDESILGGTQAIVNVAVPVTVSGNAVSVIGDSESSDAAATAPAPVAAIGGQQATTSGDDSIGGGTQALIDVAIPVTVGGNAISVIGDSQSTNATTTAPASTQHAGTAATTSGDDSILGGTQIVAPITAPVTVGGNAISVIGDASSTGATSTGPQTGGGIGPVTSGDDSVLGGSQVVAPIALPITVGGNAISVTGDSTTGGGTTVVPTDPADPTDPVTPVTTVTPGTPVTPVTPGNPAGTSVTTTSADAPTVGSSAGLGTATAFTATASTTAALAETGASPLGLGWLAAILLLGGALLAFTRRLTGAAIKA